MATSKRARLAAILLLLTLVACSDEGESPTDNDDCDGFPCLEPWFDEDYLTSGEWAQVAPCITSEHTGSVRVDIFPATAAAFYLDFEGRDAGFAEGTTIVKTEYLALGSCDGVPYRVTVMRKGPPGTAPGTGNWEWQEFDYSSRTEREGQLIDCLSSQCHTSSACGPDTDYTCIDPSFFP